MQLVHGSEVGFLRVRSVEVVVAETASLHLFKPNGEDAVIPTKGRGG